MIKTSNAAVNSNGLIGYINSKRQYNDKLLDFLDQLDESHGWHVVGV